MFVLALLLGWLPFIGPAAAGLVGGMRAGGLTNALIAAIIPSFLVAGFVLLLSAVLDLPLAGVFLGIGAFMVLVIGSLPLLAGAWAGGTLSERQGRRR